jgi:poly [ADP-ribose] polymerase 10/14/15
MWDQKILLLFRSYLYLTINFVEFVFSVCAYGKGAYFAVQSAYSDNNRYAQPDVNDVKRMLLNRVLVGVHCLGNSSVEVLPQRPGVTFNNFPVCYDSAADSNGKTPSIYVIFHDTQAYPEYLIKYS